MHTCEANRETFFSSGCGIKSLAEFRLCCQLAIINTRAYQSIARKVDIL